MAYRTGILKATKKEKARNMAAEEKSLRVWLME